jgi:hypothetical protein
MEQTERSETLVHKIQTLGDHPKERIQHYILNFTFFFLMYCCDKELNGLMENYWRRWRAHRQYNRATEGARVSEVTHTCYMRVCTAVTRS